MNARGCALVAAFLLASALARAEERDPAPPSAADTLFAEALALRDAGHYAEACAKFEETRREAPAVGVTLHLADCYAHLGRTTSAYLAFRSAEDLARARHDKREAVAHEHAHALEPTLNTLTVVLHEGALGNGETLVLDGVPLLREQCNLPLQVDPGSHTLKVVAPAKANAEPRTATVAVGPNDPPATLVVPAGSSAPKADGAAAPAVASIAEVPSAESGGSHVRRNLGLGLLGAGVAGLAVGTGFLVAKNSALPDPDPTDSAISTAGFALAGAAFAGALVVYLTAPSAADTAWSLSPMTTVGGGGALLRGGF